MNFENYVLKNDNFFIKFSQTSSKDDNGKSFFFYFYVLFEGRHFLSKGFVVLKLDKILDPQMNFRILY